MIIIKFIKGTKNEIVNQIDLTQRNLILDCCKDDNFSFWADLEVKHMYLDSENEVDNLLHFNPEMNDEYDYMFIVKDN